METWWRMAPWIPPSRRCAEGRGHVHEQAGLVERRPDTSWSATCQCSLGRCDQGGGSTRSRLVARDFKGADTGRDYLFAATPPLEAFRMVLSRAATFLPEGGTRSIAFIDAKKTHLNPRC